MGRSARGGYSLSRSPGEIRLREIIESAIGPISIVDCVIHPEACERSDECACRVLYKLVNDQITSTLDGLALSDLADNEHMTSLVCALDTCSPAPSRDGRTYCE